MRKHENWRRGGFSLAMKQKLAGKAGNLSFCLPYPLPIGPVSVLRGKETPPFQRRFPEGGREACTQSL
jgi:hypothetical protein